MWSPQATAARHDPTTTGGGPQGCAHDHQARSPGVLKAGQKVNATNGGGRNGTDRAPGSRQIQEGRAPNLDKLDQTRRWPGFVSRGRSVKTNKTRRTHPEVHRRQPNSRRVVNGVIAVPISSRSDIEKADRRLRRPTVGSRPTNSKIACTQNRCLAQCRHPPSRAASRTRAVAA